MLKFKTMRDNTPDVATHLLKNPGDYVTKSGKFLRRTSLDELPQLFSIFLGQMSFVGPRPALFNQEDLIQLRSAKKIHKILPGLTGYAQINGRDNLSIEQKVFYDEYYLNNSSFLLDIKIITITFLKLFKNKDVHH
jgi:O-antigen biosynthesis protein WbqP